MVEDPLISEPAIEAGVNNWPLYKLYGVTLASDVPLGDRLARGRDTPALTFTCTTGAPPATGWEGSAPAYASSVRFDEDQSLLYVYRQGAYDVLRYTEVADFYLWPKHIVCHRTSVDHGYMIEIYLLGTTFATWLELRGVPALHASAVVVGDRAAAFLAAPGGGKSSLATAFMQEGYPLLTDDVLAIERYGESYIGHPGYPQLRVWPNRR